MTNRRMPFSLLLAALAASVTWSACGGNSSPTCQPVAELCNGKDDDCDGQVDEGFDVGTACSAGVGACTRTGVKVCSASGATTECNALAGSPTAESCNQLDDNCDGATDEGLADCCVPTTTRACGVDMGACRAGIETCSGTGAWGACQLAGVPVTLPGTVAESCNGVDDDCDGATDEPDASGCTTLYADQDADGSGAGAGACLCAPGGAFTATAATDCDDSNAAVHPGAVEQCNGLDDNCDGQTDEGFGTGATCTAGTGACQRSGLTVCTASGSGVECNVTQGDPMAETCNGIDDNCDGRTDEGLAAPGCALQTGVCAGSKQTCGGAAGWLACTAASYPSSYQAVETTCDSLDNDCDGQTDEGPVGGGSCFAGTGACQASGTFACVAGTVTCNAVPGTPSNELCNGLDDNCNGTTDEGFTVGPACTVGVGACARVGSSVCKADGTGTQCSAVAGAASAEVCNGVDDDCDGATDEANATGCTVYYQDQDLDGYGNTGASACLCAPNATYGATVGGDCDDTNAAVRPGATEICNGRDDDCDGSTDEGILAGAACTVGTGACQASGNFACVSGAFVCNAVAGAPTVETCNGIDDNCNGTTDEGLTAPYCPNQTGVCVGSRRACGGAAGWLDCTAASYPSSYQAVETTCDGLDNDCNGQTDEGPVGGGSCSVGTGACQASGTFACVAGMVRCNAVAGTPSAETCNGIDDNCNGTTDEGVPGVGAACDGPDADLCANGVWVCSSGAMTCNETGPGFVEICGNGIDDDCDGQTDEAPCP